MRLFVNLRKLYDRSAYTSKLLLSPCRKKGNFTKLTSDNDSCWTFQNCLKFFHCARYGYMVQKVTLHLPILLNSACIGVK